MRASAKSRGFVLVSMVLILMVLFIVVFSLMTLSESRTRMVRLNTNRAVLAAEARAGLAEAAHYLAALDDWTTAPTEVPTAEASLNSGSGVYRKLQVVDATATEVHVKALAYTKDLQGRPAVTRQLDATFRRQGISYPGAALLGQAGVHLDSNARTDSYDSSRGNYEGTAGNEGHVGSNSTQGTPITMDANADVKGNLVIQEGTTPDVAGNATYITEDYQTEPIPVPLMTPPAALAAASSQGDVDAAGSSTTTLSPGRYGDLTSNAGSVIVLNAGTYIFDSIDTHRNTKIKVAGGKVKIFFRGPVTFGSNNQINMDAPNQDSSTFQMFADSSVPGDKPVLLNSNVQIVGTIYNTDGSLVLESFTEVFGTVVGKTIRMRSNAVAHFDKSLQNENLAPDPTGSAFERSSWAAW